ncbi:MAG: LysM peptidoglycan-binding domain-containing protein [Thermodesulfobacteriota bacterium]
MMQKLFAFLCAAVVTLAPVVTAAEEVKEGEAVYHTIKKGDTLWDISEKFFNDPFRWPHLWKRNPYIKNPHLIYPGNIVRITPDGIEVLTPDDIAGLPVKPLLPETKLVPPTPPSQPEPEAVEEPSIPTPPDVKKISSQSIKRSGFVSKEELGDSGAIAAGKDDEKLLMVAGDELFLSFEDPDQIFEGKRFTIFSVGKEVFHPETKRFMGNIVENVGNLTITKADEAIEGRIDSVYKEILVGMKILPFKELVNEVKLVDTAGDIDSIIVAGIEGRNELSENDVMYVDKGAEDGLQVGNVLGVYRERKAAKDPLDRKKLIPLPPKRLGSALVIDTGDNTSTCLVLDSTISIVVGDYISTSGPSE